MRSCLAKTIIALRLATTLAVPLPSPTTVLRAASLADAYWLEHNAPGNCTWTRGTLFAGKTAIYNVTHDSTGYRKYYGPVVLQ